MVSEEEKGTARAEQIVIEEFIRDLEHTAEQVQELLIEIRNSKVDFVQIKTELKFLVENIKSLSSIVSGSGDKSSVVTRLALVEQSVQEIKTYIAEDLKDDAAINTRIALIEQKIDDLGKTHDTPIDKKSEADSVGKWKLYVTIAGGVFTLLGSVIALVVSLLTK